MESAEIEALARELHQRWQNTVFMTGGDVDVS